MLVNTDDYVFRKMDPYRISLENEGAVSLEPAKKIYLLEAEGFSQGTIQIYADMEQIELIGEMVYPQTSIEPDVPVCCDMIYVKGDGVAFCDSILLYSEEGRERIEFGQYMDTTDGMECIRNSANDDGTDTVVGMPGFMFNGVEAINVYISGNHWVGIGTNTEQLKVCRRDGKCYYLYRSEGNVTDELSFVKYRWEGYTVYNNTSSSYRLIFELFLLSNNDMILHMVQAPTSQTGTSEFICNGKSVSLNLLSEQKTICFLHKDTEGKEWNIEYRDYSLPNEYVDAYLVRSDNHYYTVVENTLNEVEIDNPSSAMFYKYGVSDIPDGELLLTLENPEVLFWTNNPTDSLLMKAELTAYPHPQSLFARADMSSESIKGIKLIAAEYTGEINVKLSFDKGDTYEEEITLAEFITTDVDSLWSRCAECQSLYMEFILVNDAKLTRFKITYQN